MNEFRLYAYDVNGQLINSSSWAAEPAPNTATLALSAFKAQTGASGVSYKVARRVADTIGSVATSPGFSGYSGVSGFSGPVGSVGGSGYSGYSGPTGTTGATGTSGFSGYSGRSGYSGYSGISGSIPAGTASTSYVDAAILHQSLGHVDWQKVLLDKVTTIDATPTTMWTSGVIAEQTVVYIDALIICDNPSILGSSCLSLQSTSERQTGGSLVSTQADRLTTTGSLGLAIATVAAIEDAITNTISIKVTGKLATTLNWYGHVEIVKSAA